MYFCGPRFLPNWIKKLLSKHFNFACRIHDFDYKVKRESRKQADLKFLSHMLANSPSFLIKTQAYFYFIAVRLFGWLFY